MQMPQPSEAHKQLEKLVGNWAGQEKIHPSPFAPQGGVATGRVQNRRSLDGFVVVQDYAQERDGKTSFTGHGVFWFDAMRQVYVMSWWDSFGSPVSEFVGGLDKGILTLSNVGPSGYSKAIFDIREGDHYGFRMEVSPDGAQWFAFLEGTYTRET